MTMLLELIAHGSSKLYHHNTWAVKRVHRHDVFPVCAFELMYVDGIVIFFVFPSD